MIIEDILQHSLHLALVKTNWLGAAYGGGIISSSSKPKGIQWFNRCGIQYVGLVVKSKLALTRAVYTQHKTDMYIKQIYS